MGSPTVAIVSFRLGGTDGVSIEAAKWARALATLGFDVFTVAGGGVADHVLPALAMHAGESPSREEVDSALARADLVVVENLCSLPLNPGAGSVVAESLRGRRAVFHHHDLPWQRAEFARFPPPPDDGSWIHVTTNEISRRELAAHAIPATVVRNTFDMDPPVGARATTRASLEVEDRERLFLQPTRAIARKNVASGMALSADLAATFWLLGSPEDGYDDELSALMTNASCRVLQGRPQTGVRIGVEDAYAASDAVLLPSVWEGFGNPAIESAVHRRPLAIGPYPVAAELAAFGFRWFGSDDHRALGAWLDRHDEELLDHNRGVAERYFSSSDLPRRIELLLDAAGWTAW